MKNKQISVAIADDHTLFAESVGKLIYAFPEFIPSFACTGGHELIELIQKNKPGILILDINLPPVNGLQMIDQIRRVSPQTRILILSMHQPSEFKITEDTFKGDGYLLKTSGKEILEQALFKMAFSGSKYFSADIKWYHEKESVTNSDFLLTKREKEIICMIAEGLTSREIAVKLFISEHTVKTHRARIREKLNVSGIAKMVQKVNNSPTEFNS